MLHDDVEKAKEAILDYLRKRPEASDDLEGIARFWIARQRIEVATASVREALDALVREGVLENVVRRSPSGEELALRYVLKKKRVEHD
jgi:hypothetical protein